MKMIAWKFQKFLADEKRKDQAKKLQERIENVKKEKKEIKSYVKD